MPAFCLWSCDFGIVGQNRKKRAHSSPPSLLTLLEDPSRQIVNAISIKRGGGEITGITTIRHLPHKTISCFATFSFSRISLESILKLGLNRFLSTQSHLGSLFGESDDQALSENHISAPFSEPLPNIVAWNTNVIHCMSRSSLYLVLP